MFFVVAIAVFFIYFSMGWSTNVVSQVGYLRPKTRSSLLLTPLQQINYQYRHQLLDRFLMQDLQFFDRPENTVGALVSRLDAYPQSLLELMGMNLGLILISVVNVVACSVLSLAFSWKLGLVVVFAGLPPLMGSGWLKIRMEAKMEASAKKQYDASASVASEAVTAIRTVSSLTMEGSVLENYTRELQIALKKTSRSVLLMMPWFSMTQSIEYFVLALGFWYVCPNMVIKSAVILRADTVLPGMAAAWCLSKTSLSSSFSSLSSVFSLPDRQRHRCSAFPAVSLMFKIFRALH